MFLLALPASTIGAKWCDGGRRTYAGCLRRSWRTAPRTSAYGLYTTFSGPWAQLAALVSLGWLATVLYFDAVISPLGTGLIYTAAGSRVSYGLARNDYFHTVFGRLTSARGPVGRGADRRSSRECICFLPFPSWQSLVGLITSARC